MSTLVQIQWTRFRFTAPKAVSDELYQAAKFDPAEFRRQIVDSHLRNRLKRAGINVGWFLLIATIPFAIAYLIDMFSTDVGLVHSCGGLFLMIGTLFILSGILTAGSFLNYVWAYRGFWRRVADAAHDSASYSEFVSLLEKRNKTGTGLDRKLSWWLAWPILILSMLAMCAAAAYFVR